jgi:hypothetical protein
MTPHLEKALDMELTAEYIRGFIDGQRDERKKIIKELNETYLDTTSGKPNFIQGQGRWLSDLDLRHKGTR